MPSCALSIASAIAFRQVRGQREHTAGSVKTKRFDPQTRGLGFIDLFTVPDRITHLRRWAFQDALLVPADPPAEPSALTVSFACVQSQVDEIAQACAELRPGCTTGPRTTPWNTVDLEVITPEGARVVMTAARPLDPDSAEARHLEAGGITAPTE